MRLLFNPVPCNYDNNMEITVHKNVTHAAFHPIRIKYYNKVNFFLICIVVSIIMTAISYFDKIFLPNVSKKFTVDLIKQATHGIPRDFYQAGNFLNA